MGKKVSLYCLIAWSSIAVWIVLQLVQVYSNNLLTILVFEILLILTSILSLFCAIMFNTSRKNSLSLFTLVITILAFLYSLFVIWVGSVLG